MWRARDPQIMDLLVYRCGTWYILLRTGIVFLSSTQKLFTCKIIEPGRILTLESYSNRILYYTKYNDNLLKKITLRVLPVNFYLNFFFFFYLFFHQITRVHQVRVSISGGKKCVQRSFSLPLFLVASSRLSIRIYCVCSVRLYY